jgi:ribulose-bisphosphate carboxylase large chain
MGLITISSLPKLSPEHGVADVSPRIVATYVIESPIELGRVAEVMAGEQSTGTFVRLPSETEALLARHAATVTSVKDLGEVAQPSLMGRARPGPIRRGEVVISYPLENVGTSLPNIMTTVAGNLFELRDLTGIRLEDIEFPDEVAKDNPGPAYGVEGTRSLVDVWERPIIGTIIKPSVGLSPADTACLCRELSMAGVDFIKDDELMADSPHSPFAQRVPAVLAALGSASQRTGRRTMYAANVTNEIDGMLRNADIVRANGGTCLMVSLNSVGLAGVLALRRTTGLPVHGHRNGWGALTRHGSLGFSFIAYQKFWRLAGVDQLHVNGLRNKFWEPDASVVASARACLRPLGTTRPVLPVFSSAQSAVQARDTYQALGSTDLMYICGGGIMGHPDGVAAGVASVVEAWSAAVEGVPATERALGHVALRRALEIFG